VLDEVAAAMVDAQSEGASRFFYCAKAAPSERDAGLEGVRNSHPTVKPVDLMRWLVRLAVPVGGSVLDPFTGSGTTRLAAIAEGRQFVGIEQSPEYIEIAAGRRATPGFAFDETAI
jgi:site-specific DNA-methyltransferase (adenine-specific)